MTITEKLRIYNAGRCRGAPQSVADILERMGLDRNSLLEHTITNAQASQILLRRQPDDE